MTSEPLVSGVVWVGRGACWDAVKKKHQTLSILGDVGSPAQPQAVHDDRQARFHEGRVAPMIHLLIESGRKGSARVLPPRVRQREQPVGQIDKTPAPRSTDNFVGEIALPAKALLKVRHAILLCRIRTVLVM
jgi:hypothetical protein